jgi:hypothetical protein
MLIRVQVLDYLWQNIDDLKAVITRDIARNAGLAVGEPKLFKYCSLTLWLGGPQEILPAIVREHRMCDESEHFGCAPFEEGFTAFVQGATCLNEIINYDNTLT